MEWRFLSETTNNIYYNLAVDHVLVYNASNKSHLNNNTKLFTVRIWRNSEKCVIVGRGQSIEREVNQSYCKKHNIHLTRRISGGGAIFEDSGTLNISCVIPNQVLLGDNFKENLDIMTNAICSSIKAYYSEKTLTELGSVNADLFSVKDNTRLFMGDYKVAGAAGYFTKGCLLYHISLLVETDMKHLNNSLLARREGYGFHEPASSVDHITKNLPSPFFVPFWQENLKVILREWFSLEKLESTTELSKNEKKLARYLEKNMYSRESWIFEKQRLNLDKDMS